METTTKYLTDGRKVAVLGKLNNVDYIVQEIFVTAAGEEIPSGENFTAKSLHDTPVESFQTKELAKHKARIAEAENRLNDLHSQLKAARETLHARRDMLANSPELKGLAGGKSRILAMFMTGTVDHLVLGGYRLTAPVAMEGQIKYMNSHFGETKYEELKLCSVLGTSKGDLAYRIHYYSDGSGSSSTEVFPFETHEEAVDKIRSLAVEKIDKNHLSMEEYDMCLSIGIQFSPEQKEAFCSHHSASLTQSITNTDGEIAKQQARRAETEQRLASMRKHILAP